MARQVSRFLTASKIGSTNILHQGAERSIPCSRSRRIHRAFPHPEDRRTETNRPKCPAGVEPTLPPWRGGRQPLHHGHDGPRKPEPSQSIGWDSNPRRRITGAVSLPLDDQCHIRFVTAMGPEGLEPSPAWLRARCSAARAMVPLFSSLRRLHSSRRMRPLPCSRDFLPAIENP